MASIPLPALDIKTPQQPDLLSKFSQLQQLRASQQQLSMQQQEAPLRMQALQQQTQLGAGQVQQQQQQLTDQKAMTAAMQSWDGKDYTQLPALVIKNGGSATAVMGLKKQILDQQTAIATQVKDQGQGALAQVGATVKKNDLITGALAPLVDPSQVPDAQLPQTLTSTVQSLVQQGVLDPQHAQAAQQIAQSGDPNAIRQGIDHFRKTLMAQSQITDDALKAAQTAKAAADAKNAAGKIDPSSPLYDPSQSSIALGTAPGAAQIQTNAVQQAGRRAAAEESARMPGEMALAAQRQALSQGDPKMAAQLLINGDATLSELRARGVTPDFIARTLFEARRASGGKYNAQAADAQYNVARSEDNVKFFGSANSLIDPGGTLDQLQQAGNNIPHGQLPALNTLADWQKLATGNGPLAHYAATALGVADDYSKVMGGGQGSDSSRLQALNLIKANASQEGRGGAVTGIRDAVVSQTKSRIGNNPVLGRMYGSPALSTAPTQGGQTSPANDPFAQFGGKGSLMATVPMLSPDGTSGDVPQANVQAAIAKGFKQAVAMTSPDGKLGYIPLERVQDAQKAGFNVDTSHPAGIGQAPQLAAHSQAPAMQSSLLAPSTYTKAVSDTASGLATPLAHIPSQIASYGGFKNPADQGGPIQSIVNNPDKGAGVADALAQVGTGIALGKAIESAPKIVNGVKIGSGAVSDAVSSSRQFVRPKSSPAIVPPEEVQAQKIAQTILPPGGIKPELIKAIQSQAPAIVEYAQRTGNPLNTQAEGLKAAQGVAAEGLQHYNDQVLAPVAGRSVTLDPANTELGDKATIGNIDSRITELNKLTNTAKANSEGAALDILAKSKWTDEANYLRGKLYSSLEHTTGIPAADIQQLREGYGGEYSLANNLEAAQNARLTRTGEQSQGKTNINLPRPSILETPGMAYNAIRGGEQAIADRQFSSAIKAVPPQAPARPLPPPIDTDALATQQAAAQQEFLRQHQLEQASQDAAAGRSQRVAGYKAAQGATQQAAASLEGEAARTIGRGNVMQQWADKGAANMSAADPSITSEMIDSLSKSASGKQLLVKASGISPNSSIMKNLIKQARGMTK